MTDTSNKQGQVTDKGTVEIAEDDLDQATGGQKVEIGALKAGASEVLMGVGSSKITPGSIRTQKV